MTLTSLKVIEYLNKKGYSRTEAMLRQESANVDAQGRVLTTRAEDRGGLQYAVAYRGLFLSRQQSDLILM